MYALASQKLFYYQIVLKKKKKIWRTKLRMILRMIGEYRPGNISSVQLEWIVSGADKHPVLPRKVDILIT